VRREWVKGKANALEGVAATITRARTRLRPTLLRTVFRLLGLVPAPLYDRLKRIPLLRSSSRRVLDATLPPEGLSVVTIESGPIRGLRFELQPRTNKDMAVGRYEPRLATALEDLLEKGDLCFDVGAHLGYMSLVMASSVAPGGKVVAFEPDPDLFEPLLRNVERNERALAPVVPVAAAAGQSPGRCAFRHGTSSGTGRLDEAEGDVTVTVLTLDHAAHVHGMPRLVKVDVEGAEVEALQGATEILNRGESAFLVEAHSEDLEERCRALLRGYHYDVNHLDPARDETAHLLARPQT
jgi:FkbM family methyltransferase